MFMSWLKSGSLTFYPLWQWKPVCWCIFTLQADDVLCILWTDSGPGHSQKSKTLGQKFIQLFPGNQKTGINCEESNSSESAAGKRLPLRNAKNVMQRLWRVATAHQQVTLPELTRAEHKASSLPGMLVCHSLRTWISWWAFGQVSVILIVPSKMIGGLFRPVVPGNWTLLMMTDDSNN